MSTTAILMVRDEADIITDTIGHLLGQVDHVIVADNGSVDGTREILAALPVELIDDPEVGYYQSAKMSRLAALAGLQGADWVVPCDADEMWFAPSGTLRDWLAGVAPDRAVVGAALYDHVATGIDPPGTPTKSMGWRRTNPAKLPKVACRPNIPVTIAMGNHAVRFHQPMPAIDGLTIRHFPYRSAAQMTRKVANGWQGLAAAADLPEGSGQHWRDYAALEAANPGAIGEVFREWFWYADPASNPDLIFDPCPSR